MDAWTLKGAARCRSALWIQKASISIHGWDLLYEGAAERTEAVSKSSGPSVSMAAGV